MVHKRTCMLCDSRNNLFSFPKETHMQKKWLNAIGLSPDHVLKTTNKVCGSHFSLDQFKHLNAKRLKDDACPSNLVDNEPRNVEENEAKSDGKNKNMCVICGFTTTKSFFRFPKKNIHIREQWAKFVGIKEDLIKPNDRLCDRHFTSEDYETTSTRKSIKTTCVPTLVPKFKSSQNDDSESSTDEVQASIVSLVSAELLGENGLENVPCSEEIPSAIPKIPKRYFRFFGDIVEDDVIYPETAKLALKMGKQEVEKYRKQVQYLKKENIRLKTRCSRLEDTVADLQKKIRLF